MDETILIVKINNKANFLRKRLKIPLKGFKVLFCLHCLSFLVIIELIKSE